MATPLKPRTYVPRLRDNRIDGVKYNRSSSKRNNFEMFAWLGMRLSGVAQRLNCSPASARHANGDVSETNENI